MSSPAGTLDRALYPKARLFIAAQTFFRGVAVLPAVLLVVFGVIWLYERSGRKPHWST